MGKLAVMALACLLAGCAGNQPPPIWVRTDGRSVDEKDLGIQQIVCRREMEKASLSSEDTQHRILLTPNGPISERAQAMGQVYTGCMAQHGYLQSN
jgi:hypothetical protein